MVGNFNNTRLNFKGLFLGLFVFIAVFGMVFACKAPVTPTVPEPETYTVTFHFDDKTQSETYTAGEELELLTKEEAGISDDYELEWYTDSDYTEKAHGGTPVNSNLDIYGKLTEIDTSIEYTVKFMNDGGTALGEEQKVNAGGSVTEPVTPTPEKSEHEGWIFSGWSLSPEGTDLLSVSDDKISIKASWAGDGNVITIYAVYIDPDSQKPVIGIELSPGEDFELYVGDTKNLAVIYTPEDANVGKDLSWTCTPEGIVKVESTADGGKVTALSEGSATITVKLSGDGSVTDSVKVNVSEKTVNVSFKSGVMLQGFNWSSASRTNNSVWNTWYGIMEDNAEAIKNRFEYVWFPPPSMSASFGPEGYLPTQLNDFNSYYGSESELRAVISAIKPAKAIADVVINHRNGSTDYGDFTNPSWTEDFYSICSNDEGFTESPVMSASSKRGNPDTGESYSAARDIDHTNTSVQNGIITWMNDELKDLGFVGWRYDYVKGYGGEYVGYYNAKTNPEFSVGEYWPEGGADWVSEIDTWLTETEASINGTQGMPSKAFDFVLKRNLNEAFGWYKNSTDQGSEDHKTLWDMSKLADANTLMRKNPSRAVTFVDNHDTGSSQLHWCLDPGDLGPAYAFILTHPGYPCVAWQHYFTFAESGEKVDPEQYIGENEVPGTENTYRQHIDYLIDLRQRIGIEYDDVVDVVGKSSNYYAGKITGLNGEIVVVIGNGYIPSGKGYEGNNPIYAGTNFAIWEKGVNGTDSIGGGGTEPGETASITVTCANDWTWNDGVKIFAWVWGGSYGGGQWIPCSGSGTTVNFDITDDLTAFLLVRCHKDTVTPDWGATAGSAGEIYNKTNDITYSSGQTSYNGGNWGKP